MNPAAAAAGREAGVYRSNEKLFGFDVWYAVDWTGDVVAVRVVPKEEAPRALLELAEIAGVDSTPPLTLVAPGRGASRASVLLAAVLPRQLARERQRNRLP
jgi:hypothetical protein